MSFLKSFRGEGGAYECTRLRREKLSWLDFPPRRGNTLRYPQQVQSLMGQTWPMPARKFSLFAIMGFPLEFLARYFIWHISFYFEAAKG